MICFKSQVLGKILLPNKFTHTKALSNYGIITYIFKHYREHQTFAMVMWDFSPITYVRPTYNR